MSRTVLDLDEASLAHIDADFDAIAKVRPGIAMVRIDQPPAP